MHTQASDVWLEQVATFDVGSEIRVVCFRHYAWHTERLLGVIAHRLHLPAISPPPHPRDRDYLLQSGFTRLSEMWKWTWFQMIGNSLTRTRPSSHKVFCWKNIDARCRELCTLKGVNRSLDRKQSQDQFVQSRFIHLIISSAVCFTFRQVTLLNISFVTKTKQKLHKVTRGMPNGVFECPTTRCCLRWSVCCSDFRIKNCFLVYTCRHNKFYLEIDTLIKKRPPPSVVKSFWNQSWANIIVLSYWWGAFSKLKNSFLRCFSCPLKHAGQGTSGYTAVTRSSDRTDEGQKPETQKAQCLYVWQKRENSEDVRVVIKRSRHSTFRVVFFCIWLDFHSWALLWEPGNLNSYQWYRADKTDSGNVDWQGFLLKFWPCGHVMKNDKNLICPCFIQFQFCKCSLRKVSCVWQKVYLS